MADEPKRGGLGEFMRQFNEVLKEVIEASQGPAPGGGFPRPRPAQQAAPQIPQPGQPAPRPAEPAPRVVASALSGGVRDNLAETEEQKLERQRQQRQNHLREEQERQRKHAAFRKQQEKLHQEQHLSDSARKQKNPKTGASAVALRYRKFLLGKPQNIRDAVMLAEIIGPCLARKDRP